MWLRRHVGDKVIMKEPEQAQTEQNAKFNLTRYAKRRNNDSLHS